MPEQGDHNEDMTTGKSVKYLLSSRESIFRNEPAHDPAWIRSSIMGVSTRIRESLQTTFRSTEEQTSACEPMKYIFHTSWTIYIVCMSLIGGAIMYSFDGGTYIDSWFLATSSLVCSGLSVEDPNLIHKNTYITSSLLSFFGSSVFLLLPSIGYRIYKLRQLMPLMNECLQNIEDKIKNLDSNGRIAADGRASTKSDDTDPFRSSISIRGAMKSRRSSTSQSEEVLKNDSRYIKQYISLYNGSIVTFVTIVIYILFWHVFGAIFLTMALRKEDMESSLKARGFTNFQNGLFLTVSSLANAGLSLSADSYVFMNSNAAALIVTGILIVAGNVLLPVFLRWFLIAGKWLCARRGFSKWERAFEWTLRNPRRITTQVFLASETSYLVQFSLISNFIILILMASVELNRDVINETYGTPFQILGLSYFQILNCRHSGFTSISMRDLSQSTLLVLCLAMYLSPIPFIGMLAVTGEESLRQVQGKAPAQEGGTSSLIAVAKRVVIGFWFLKMGLLFVLAALEKNLLNDNPDINLWYVIFELVSAYGLVGLTLGAPNKAYSLAGAFSKPGKICVIIAFYLGKHRGLPAPSDPVVDFDFLFLRDVIDANRTLHQAERRSDNTILSVIHSHGDSVGIRQSSLMKGDSSTPLHDGFLDATEL